MADKITQYVCAYCRGGLESSREIYGVVSIAPCRRRECSAPEYTAHEANKLDAAIRKLDSHGGSEQIAIIKVESVRVAIIGMGLTVDEVRRALVYCRERCQS